MLTEKDDPLVVAGVIGGGSPDLTSISFGNRRVYGLWLTNLEFRLEEMTEVSTTLVASCPFIIAVVCPRCVTIYVSNSFGIRTYSFSSISNTVQL